MKALNYLVRKLKAQNEFSLKYPKLDKESLRIQVYSDDSYGTNSDGTSQLGYIIFLADKFESCQPIFWTSYKSRRVSRSVLCSETMAFADAFDMAFAIRYDLSRMMNSHVPITALTDSLSLFDVITKATIPTEKRLMVDLQTVKESYKKEEIGQYWIHPLRTSILLMP